MNINRVEIQCAVNTHKSIAIPERLGFTIEGIKREEKLVEQTIFKIRTLYNKIVLLC